MKNTMKYFLSKMSGKPHGWDVCPEGNYVFDATTGEFEIYNSWMSTLHAIKRYRYEINSVTVYDGGGHVGHTLSICKILNDLQVPLVISEATSSGVLYACLQTYEVGTHYYPQYVGPNGIDEMGDTYAHLYFHGVSSDGEDDQAVLTNQLASMVLKSSLFDPDLAKQYAKAMIEVVCQAMDRKIKPHHSWVVKKIIRTMGGAWGNSTPFILDEDVSESLLSIKNVKS
uniref:Uncharacterized protein n=1 Tax=viral metagenome TaxID=1070528 RepID=A0A2V0RBY9_9ZZZZ